MKDYLKMHASQAAYETWLASPDFITPNVSTISGSSSVLYKQVHDYSKDYFTTVAKETGTISFSGSTATNTLSYSTDNGATWSTAAQKPSVTLGSGEKVLWKGECIPDISNDVGIGNFTNDETATFDIEGNVMSLLFGDDFKGQTSLEGKEGAFMELFNRNKVISAENLSLPATTLTNCCYSGMFYGCTSLTTAPELPATTVAPDCYSGMFSGCTSLTTAPALPATTLADNCYYDMFRNCTSLTTAPALPATTLANNCYFQMFSGCTSLTTAPTLPATRLVYYCYNSMFNGCTSLNYIKCLATDISASYCTYNWVNGVASSGTFVKNASMSWPTGTSGIRTGWTVQDAA